MIALLVDGPNLIRRIYAAQRETPSRDDQQRAEATASAAAASLGRALSHHRPSHGLVALDPGGRHWRHDLYPDYKRNRSPMPPALHRYGAHITDAFNALGLRCLSLPDFAVEDVIATAAAHIADHGGCAVILSTDRSYCQLLGRGISVYDHFAGRPLDGDMITKRFGVRPQQLPELLAMAGDSSVSVPGIQSVGPRTAAKLLSDYGDLEKVLEAAEHLPGKLGAKLRTGRDDARLAKKLFTMRRDVHLGINLKELRCTPPHRPAAPE